MKKLIVIVSIGIASVVATAQPVQLQTGFDPDEYLCMLGIIARQNDTVWDQIKIPLCEGYSLLYRSPEYPLKNQFDLWLGPNHTAVLHIHATKDDNLSWAENYYAAMCPASGQWNYSSNQTFNYKLSENPRAAVHAGWLAALAYMHSDIIHQVDALREQHCNNIIITGHSQGGAIAYLCTSWLRYLQIDGAIAPTVRFKTYCSAAPKPGNLYYAYDYEILTQQGWAYNVVNPLDWVPETPFSLQTTNDFNKLSPFYNARSIIKKQGFAARLVLKPMFNSMNRPLTRTTKRFHKYMGKKMYRQIEKSTGLQQPDYDISMNYARAGNYIVLQPDSLYMSKYGADTRHMFVHHLLRPYYELTLQMKENNLTGR